MGKRAKHHLPLLFNIITNQCRTIPTIIPQNSNGETYLLDDGRLFDLGGIERNDDYFPYRNKNNYHYNPLCYLKSAHIFDASTKNWTPIQQMHKTHFKSNIVQIGSRIYLVQ